MSKAGMGMSMGTNVVHKGAIDPSQNCVDSTRNVYTGLIDSPVYAPLENETTFKT